MFRGSVGRWAAGVSLLASLPGCVFAQESRKQPLQEVFETELVYTQDPGEIQMTLGFAARRKKEDANIYQWPVQVEYGVTRKLQVGAAWEGPARISDRGQPPAYGAMDWHAGAKYSFMNIRGSDFHAAVTAEVGIPTGRVASGFSEGFLEYEVSGLVARDLPRLRNAQIFSQTGVAFLQRAKGASESAEQEPAAHDFRWNGGFFVPLHRVIGTAEFAWNTNRWNHSGRTNEVYFAPGSVWKIRGRWECGLGTAFGLTPQADRWAFTVKLTKEFPTREDQVEKGH